MRIAVGGIVHARETIPTWVEGLMALDTEGLEIVRCYVTDGPPPGNESWSEVLKQPDVVIPFSPPGPRYRRQGGTASERQVIFARLAALRNRLADVALAHECHALFAVDSDIVVPPHTLMALVATGRPWVAALVRNSATNRKAWNVFEVRHLRQGGLVHHFLPTGKDSKGRRWPGPEGAGWDPRGSQKYPLAAGAVCLYHRELLLQARWDSPPLGSGEDTGFALQAFAAGYRAWYLPIICRHLTIPGEGVGSTDEP